MDNGLLCKASTDVVLDFSMTQSATRLRNSALYDGTGATPITADLLFTPTRDHTVAPAAQFALHFTLKRLNNPISALRRRPTDLAALDKKYPVSNCTILEGCRISRHRRKPPNGQMAEKTLYPAMAKWQSGGFESYGRSRLIMVCQAANGSARPHDADQIIVSAQSTPLP